MANLGDIYLRIAESEGPEALRASIIGLLRSGTTNTEILSYIADLFDPASNAKCKVEITYRKEGAEKQRRQRSENLIRLTEIYRGMKNVDNFKNHAATLTGLDLRTIGRYLKEVVALAAELDASDEESFRIKAEFRKSQRGTDGI